MMNAPSRSAGLVVLGTVVLLIAMSVFLLRPPAVVNEETDQAGFSAERAFRYVQAIAQRPHASGTDDHRRVRRYIVSELQALGLQTEVQSLTVTGNRFQQNSLSHVYNVLGRIKGHNSEKAVLLVAHYDSQPNTPGAGDNASGVAILLEIARLLKKELPPRNDIIFLLTDGEEYGLFGAKGFLQHPWFREVGLVLNAEGRGNRGLSITFEMSEENGWLVQEYGRSAPYPFANSLSYEVYKALPNDTDFTIFREGGLTGLNMAFVGGLVNYHSMTDTPANLNLRTLQHQGSNLLAMARHFGNISLENTRLPDQVFFNTIGFHLVWYPLLWDSAFLTLAAILYLCSVLLALVQQDFRAEVVLYAFFAQIGLLVGAMGLTWLLTRLIRIAFPLSYHFMDGGTYGDTAYYLAYAGLCLLLYAGGMSTPLMKRLPAISLAVGAQTIWFILAVSLHLAAPSAAYFFLFPLLFALVGQLIFQVTDKDPERSPFLYACLHLLGLVPAILMIVPVVYLLYPVFGMHLPLAGSLVCALGLALITPLIRIVGDWRPALLAYSATTIVCLSLCVAAWLSGSSPERPLQSHVSYYLDADEGTAFWVSSFSDTDFWNEQFFTYPEVAPLSEVYPFMRSNRLKSPARAINLPAPDIRILEDTTYRGQRHVGATIRSQNNGCHMQLWVRNRKGVHQVSIDGQLMKLDPISGPGGRYFFWTFYGLPREREINLDLLVSDLGVTELVVIDQSLGLPPDLNYIPMPPEVIPGTGREANLTVIKRTVEL